jgi:hypothetical protein
VSLGIRLFEGIAFGKFSVFKPRDNFLTGFGVLFSFPRSFLNEDASPPWLWRKRRPVRRL